MTYERELQESIMLNLWDLYYKNHPIDNPFHQPSKPSKPLKITVLQAIKWFWEDFLEALKHG